MLLRPLGLRKSFVSASLSSHFRSMASLARPSGKFLFYVHAPDCKEEGTFQKRLSVRPQHLELIKANIANGSIRVAGVMLTDESLHAAPEDRKMIGSTIIWEAESKEEVQKKIEADPYYLNGVWDKERIVITPMMPATPIP